MSLLSSKLHNENTFYKAFLNDLKSCKQEVIIESPYIAQVRLQMLKPILEKLIKRGIEVFIITRYPNEHGEPEDEELTRQMLDFLNLKKAIKPSLSQKGLKEEQPIAKFGHHDDTCCWVLNLTEAELKSMEFEQPTRRPILSKRQSYSSKNAVWF